MAHPFRITAVSVISAISAMAGTVIYLTQFSESGKLSLVERADTRSDIDSELRGLEGIKYRSDGQIAYRWRAEKAERLLSNGSVRLEAPYYIGNIGEQRPWTAEAHNGELSQNGDQLDLTGSVLVKDLIREAKITSETLRIDLKSNNVSTASAMTLTLPNGKTDSVGMRASLNDERVELLSQVRGHYEP